MKIALIVLAALIAIVVIITIIGSRLPVAHTASRAAVIAQTPEAVYASVRQRIVGEKDYLIAEEQPPRRLVSRVREGLPYGGTWTFELAPEGNSTRVTITEHGQVYNPLFRFLSRFVFGQTATMDQFLADLRTPEQ